MAEERFPLNRYHYAVKNVELTMESHYSYRDGAVTYLNLIHRYTEQRLPAIQLGLEMEIEQIAELYRNRDRARLKLDIVEQILNAQDEIVGSSLYLRHTFSIIPARDQTVYMTSTDLETLRNADPMRKLQNFEMYLIDMDAVGWFDKELEIDNIEETSFPQVLLVPFLLRNVPGNILMITPPHQGGPVSGVTAPIGTLLENIRHLNDVYGLYRGNPIVYYDLKYLYCLHKQEPNIELEFPEDFGTVTFMLADPDEPEYKAHGSYDDTGRETHWVNLNHEPFIDDVGYRDLTASEASTFLFVDSSGKVDKDTVNGESSRLVYAYVKNDLTRDQLRNETIHGKIVDIAALDSSIRFLKPYKDYTFTVGNSHKELGLDNGNIYRLLGWSLNIRREGLDSYISEVGVTVYDPSVTMSVG